MERAKISLLSVIATLLAVLVFQRGVPEAHAQSATTITCNAWYKEAIGQFKGPEKALEIGRLYGEEVKAWLLQNPGQPVFRTTLVQGAGLAYLDVMCVAR